VCRGLCSVLEIECVGDCEWWDVLCLGDFMVG
jgi:hypothetical protein